MNQQMPGAPGGYNKQCRYCYQIIDGRYKRCPYCAGDLRNWFMRHKITTGLLASGVGFFGLIFLIIIAALAANTSTKSADTSKKKAETNQSAQIVEESQSEESSQPEEQGDEITPVDIKTLIADYDSNQLSANEKYQGTTIKLTGYVDNISKGLGGKPYIILKPSDEQFYIGTNVQCFSNEDEAKKLTNGQQATLVGKAKEMSMGIIIIEDCVVSS